MEEVIVKSPLKRKALREEIESNLLSTSEVEEILNISRARLSQVVKSGMLTPIKYGTYLKDDIYAYKEAFEDARDNNKWLKDFE